MTILSGYGPACDLYISIRNKYMYLYLLLEDLGLEAPVSTFWVTFAETAEKLITDS